MKSSFILFPPIKCISNCIWRLFRKMNSCEFIVYSLPSNQMHIKLYLKTFQKYEFMWIHRLFSSSLQSNFETCSQIWIRFSTWIPLCQHKGQWKKRWQIHHNHRNHYHQRHVHVESSVPTQEDRDDCYISNVIFTLENLSSGLRNSQIWKKKLSNGVEFFYWM